MKDINKIIVVSIALIKSRILNAKKLVDDLMAGSRKPDKIYFFISEEQHHIDDGIKPQEIPNIDNPIVEFIYTPNIGSLRKIVPIVKMYWTRPNTRIIVCDDDRKIQPDIIHKLVDFSENGNHRFHACATAGNLWTTEGINNSNKRHIILGWTIQKPVQVDLLNSGMQMLIKPKFFHEDILHWEKYIEKYAVNLTDETFISYLLAKKETPRFVIPIAQCPMQLPVKEQLHDTKYVENFKGIQARGFYPIMKSWHK